jgi:hypothetical protein
VKGKKVFFFSLWSSFDVNMTIKTHSDTHIVKKRWYIERVWGAAKRRKNISRFAAGRRHLPVQTHAECVEKHLPFFIFWVLCIFVRGS